MDSGLVERWRRLVGSGPEAIATGTALMAQWSEPYRAYHTLAHLTAVLDRLDELAAERVVVTPAVRLSAWFHDAVYDPRAADNEARSAELAAVVLPPLGVDEGTVAEVARLVRLTAGHRPVEGDTAGAALCDADLAVLAALTEDYWAYAAAIRREYRHVPDAAFRTGRAAVLADLLDRPQLYHTPAGRRRWEAAARANVAAELVSLAAAGASG